MNAKTFARVGVVLVASAATLAVAEPPADPLRVGYVETSEVDVVEAWPFLVRAKRRVDAELCSDLGPGDLEVTEDGEEVRLIAVDRAAPLTTHVLLLDTSSSMADPNRVGSRKKGRQTKAAARTYVRWMLDDERGHTGGVADEAIAPGTPAERLMIVTFDDDLWMRVPPTVVAHTDAAARVIRGIDAIQGGYFTTLNDAVYRTFHYLGSRSGRAVVILLSDGADMNSLRPYDDVAEAARQANNVTVFPIGIGIGRGPYQEFLQQLAETGGGRYYTLGNRRPGSLEDPLTKRFEDIRARLRSQLYVSYLAAPSGDLEQRASDDDGRGLRRKVRIESREPRCEIPRDGYRRIRSVRAADAVETGPTDDAGTGAIADGPLLRLPLNDIVRDADPLLRYGDDTGGTAIWTTRTVEIVVPPFPEELLGATERPSDARRLEDILHDWLTQGRIPARDFPGSTRSRLEPQFPIDAEINGKTFLENRGRIARALFESDPAYRDWATIRFRQRIDRRYRAAVPPPADPEARERYERAMATIVRQHTERIGPQDYERDLADWLEDVGARELAFRLERKQAELLLSGEADSAAQVDVVQSRWLRLHDWLHFPDRTRVITPLELACDPLRAACGFYRIVLPRFTDLPEDPDSPGKLYHPKTLEQWATFEQAKVPKHPFGLMLVRWLLGMPTRPGEPTLAEGSDRRSRLAGELRTNWRIGSIAHRLDPAFVPRGRGKRPLASDRCARRVSLGLESSAGDLLSLDVIVDGVVTGALAEEPEPEVGGPLRGLPPAGRTSGEKAARVGYRDPCETSAAPVQAHPRCFLLTKGPRNEMAELLRGAGIERCGR